ncbi:MAG: hypothetical protein KF681_02895 [Bdellovibrionaceae bacterium]|nr:hypothetical protein [Pseudobdellovibrionaceae bacterium]
MLSILVVVTSLLWSAPSWSAPIENMSEAPRYTDQTSLLDVAQGEAATSLQPGASKEAEEKAAKKNKKANKPESLPTVSADQISMLRLEDNYETPRARDFDFKVDLSFESFKLKGLVPNANLGNYDAERAGDIPLFALHFGFLYPFTPKFSAGLSAFGGYGFRQYDLTAPNGSSVNPRLNVVAYGFAAEGRYQFTKNWFGDLAYENGQMGIRQSSSETTLAQWSENGATTASRLSAGYTFASRWELSGGYLQRKLSSSRFDLESSQWSLATGVKW